MFGSGVLWLFDGTDQALPEADFQFEPTTPNTRVGEAVAAAGDINEDGYDDVYIASRMGSSAGRIEIFLGSASGLSSDRQLLAEGNSSERLGRAMASNGDIDGDGLGDLVYSLRSTSRGEAYGLDYLILSERDWESIAFEYQGTVNEVELGTASRGETSIVYTHEDTLRHHVSKLEHMNDGTPSGQWVDQTVASLNTSHLGVAFGVRSSGQPVLLVEDRTSMVLHSTSSLTALEQDVATTGTMGQWLGSTATHDNKQVLAYSSGAGNQIFAATQSTTGWSSELVRTGANLASSIEVHVDSQDVPHLVYRHDATSQLELAVGGSAGRSLRWAMRVKRFQRSTPLLCFQTILGCRFGLFERHRNQPCGVDLRRYDPVPPQRHKPHRPQQRNQPRHVNQRLAAPRCADDQRRPPRVRTMAWKHGLD